MNARLEIAPTADAAQAAIADEFAFFGDWTERYQYLIDLGRKLPPFPDALKTDANKVTGCQSLVWLVPSGDARRPRVPGDQRFGDRLRPDRVASARLFGTVGG